MFFTFFQNMKTFPIRFSYFIFSKLKLKILKTLQKCIGNISDLTLGLFLVYKLSLDCCLSDKLLESRQCLSFYFVQTVKMVFHFHLVIETYFKSFQQKFVEE